MDPIPTRRSVEGTTRIVLGLDAGSPQDVALRLSTEVSVQAMASLKRHEAGIGSVAASCSAVLLLQSAGLLRGRHATTSCWLAAERPRREPDCEVDANRMVVSDELATTAGAAFGQSDLMLHLIRICFSPSLTDAKGKALLIDGPLVQSRLVVTTMLANGIELIEQSCGSQPAALGGATVSRMTRT